MKIGGGGRAKIGGEGRSGKKEEQGLQCEIAGVREGRAQGRYAPGRGVSNDPRGKRGAQKTTFMLSLEFLLNAKEMAPGGF